MASKPSRVIVTAAFLAKKKGVTRGAVSHAAKPGGALHSARVARGRFDQSDPGLRAWLGESDDAPTSSGKRPSAAPAAPTKDAGKAPKAAAKPTKGDRKATFHEREDAAAADMDVKQERARGLRLKNDTLEGKLISREIVDTHMFGALDALSNLLLRDTARTIARESFALCRGGSPLEEAERAIRDRIGSSIESVKAQVARLLRDAARSSHQRPRTPRS